MKIIYSFLILSFALVGIAFGADTNALEAPHSESASKQITPKIENTETLKYGADVGLFSRALPTQDINNLSILNNGVSLGVRIPINPNTFLEPRIFIAKSTLSNNNDAKGNEGGSGLELAYLYNFRIFSSRWGFWFGGNLFALNSVAYQKFGSNLETTKAYSYGAEGVGAFGFESKHFFSNLELHLGLAKSVFRDSSENFSSGGTAALGINLGAYL